MIKTRLNFSALFLALLLAAIGLGFISLALRETNRLITQVPLADAQKQYFAMASWPSTPGQLTKIEIIADTSELDSIPSTYRTAISYTFSKNNVQYRGSYELPSYSRFEDVKSKLLELGCVLPNERSEESLEVFGFDRKYIYQSSQPSIVYFDPTNPVMSTLNPHLSPPTWWQHTGDGIVGITFLSVLGAALFLLAGSVIGIRSPLIERFLSWVFTGSVIFRLFGIFLLGAAAFIFWNEVYAAEFPNIAGSVVALVICSGFAFGGICLVRLSLK